MAKAFKLFFLLLLLLNGTHSLVSGMQEDTVASRVINLKVLDGQSQQQKAGSLLPKPVRLYVSDMEGLPAEGVSVRSTLSYSPKNAKGFTVSPEAAETDSAGVVIFQVRLGDIAGEYLVGFSAENQGGTVLQSARFTAQRKNWVFLLVIGLFGGLGLFLLGMNMMSKGMQKSAGERMRSILGNLTRNRIVALGLGTFVTMVIQSSSATTVMLISFVNSGLMTFTQTLGVILGADIGTTITAQLIAFNLTDYALLMIALGFALNTFTKNEKTRNIGEAVLGFGMLFFGMHIMSEAMYPLRSYDPLIDFILRLENPLTGILFGALFTALIQSSSAFIGIMIVLATQGLLSLEAGVPMLLGANIGTAVTAILASLNSSRDAKRVAYAHVIFKVLGVLLLVGWIPAFVDLIRSISPQSGGGNGMDVITNELPRQIANAHTLFNVIMTLLFLPFLNLFSKLIYFLIPVKEVPVQSIEFQPKYLSRASNLPPALALKVIKEETVHMAHIVQDMTSNFLSPFLLNEAPDTEWMSRREEEVDFLRDRINISLREVASAQINTARTNEAFEIMYVVKEFEQIADLIYDTYLEKSEEWKVAHLEFSEEGKKELEEYHLQVLKQMSRAIEVFREINLAKARHMEEKHRKYRVYAMELEKNHYQRVMQSIEKSVNTSKIHLEFMSVLGTIYSHSTNIARIMLQWSETDAKTD
jgi:phosphate:Na+ symporter